MSEAGEKKQNPLYHSGYERTATQALHRLRGASDGIAAQQIDFELAHRRREATKPPKAGE